jgi:hypothetical protein
MMNPSDEARVPGWAAALAVATRAPRCGALNRAGGRCQAPAMRGKKRCRFHGGKSTGPRTAEGLERSRRANWKHGRRSAEAAAERSEAVRIRRELRRLMELLA